MKRNTELLSHVSYSLSTAAETWEKAGILTHDEVERIKSAVWSVVLDAKEKAKAEASERLAKETAECL
jgi:hypothetical protein